MPNTKLDIADYPGFVDKPKEEQRRILNAINKRRRRLNLDLISQEPASG